jgi:hypothetical protein
VSDLYIEDELLFSDLDITEEAGFNAARDLIGSVTVDDGSRTIRTSGGVQKPKQAFGARIALR